MSLLFTSADLCWFGIQSSLEAVVLVWAALSKGLAGVTNVHQAACTYPRSDPTYSGTHTNQPPNKSRIFDQFNQWISSIF